MCDCCDASGPARPSRRSILRAAALGVVSLPVARALAGTRAYGATTATATDVSGTALATPAVGDAAYGLTWFAGDTHVHDDHSADGSFLRQTAGQGSPGNLGVADQVAQGERTGLAWMPLTDHRTYNQHWDPQWTSSTMLLIPGEEAQGSPHAVCLGSLEEVVDGAQPATGPVHRHNQQALWETHAQGALWGTAHPVFRPDDPANRDVTGVDWIEAWNRASDPDEELDYAEARWNEGLRCGVTGGCDDHFRELWAVAGPGNPMTYVGLSVLTERSLMDGLRAGRTAVSSGPDGALVTLEADLDGDGIFEALGGDEVAARAGATGTLRVRLQRGTGTTVTVLAAPGRNATAALAQMTGTLPDQTWTVPVTVPSGPAGGGTWWRVEVRGPGRMAGLDTSNRNGYPGTIGQITEANQLQAISPPVYVTTSGPTVFAPSTPLPAAVAAGADDAAAPVVLGAVGGVTCFPDVAADGATTHVVAEQHVPGGTQVVYRRLPDGAPVPLSGASGTARLPRVACLPGSSVLQAVWSEELSGQLPRRPDVMTRRSTDGGRTWGAAVAVTSVAAQCRAERPTVVLLADGTPVIAWQENTAATPPSVAAGVTVGSAASAFEVLVKVGTGAAVAVSRPGKTVAAPSVDDTRTALYPASLFPSLALLPDGRVAVAWQDDRFDPDPLFTGHTNPSDPNAKPASTTDPDAWEPMVAVRSPAGAWGAPVRVAPDLTLAQRHPTLAARADGLLACVWDAKSSQASSGSDPVLRWASSDDGGVSWAARGPVDPPPGVGMQQRPRLAAVSDGGGLQLAWDDGRHADWRFRVRTATLPAGALAWTGAADVSTAGNALFAAVSGGRVTWTTDRGAAAQRDPTQRVVLAGAVVDPAPSLPELPLAALLPVAGLAAAGVALARVRARATAG